ncbi:hypothetical protein AA12717_0872 [Gluconacetobacter sacchari DSM 12717]|uniref:Thiol:disulfide interchange protein DsbG n=1 Tax=Gluconacetobacter sacchari DSM 12717 TaxID=1307940 RepID=A0ABQ0P446_9PROT|nr:hypothetical protein AA12717_0872 [Gluconacetobacter sacchari DSM 12717]
MPPLPPGTVRPFTTEEISALPALAALASDGRILWRLGPPVDGLQGVFARKGDRYQVYYLVLGGKHLVRGELYDLDGTNETLALLRSVPGALPTVRIGRDSGVDGGPSAGTAPSLLLAKAYGGSMGTPGAPHVWMMIDPFCGPSVLALRALTPLVEAGKLRLTLLPVSLNDYEDKGSSTRVAQLLLSLPPGEVAGAWNRIIDRWSHTQGTVETDRLWASDWAALVLAGRTTPAGEDRTNASLHLDANTSIANDLGVKGTPTLFWVDRNGHTQQSAGVPADINGMVAEARP